MLKEKNIEIIDAKIIQMPKNIPKKAHILKGVEYDIANTKRLSIKKAPE